MPKGFIAFYQKHLASFRDLTEVAFNFCVCARTRTHSNKHEMWEYHKKCFGKHLKYISSVFSLIFKIS